MTDADALKADYRSFLLQTVSIRRYSGLGAARTYLDYAGAGHAKLYDTSQLVPGITQGDQRVLVMADDLVTSGITLPVRTDDHVMVGDVQLGIIKLGTRKALDGTLIAYEIQARG